MSVSILRRFLAELLSRFPKLLASIHRFPLALCRLINCFFAFPTSSFCRWTRTNPRRPALHEHQGSPASSTALGDGVVCAMNVPSSGPSDTHERSWHSPVDSPYTSVKSQSGHLVPYSPAPARRYSQDHIPWMTGSQTSLHDEPSSINHDAPQVVADPVLQSSSSTSIHTHHRSHPPTSDILTHPSAPPSPLHRTLGFAPETSPGNSGVQTPPHLAHVHLDANQPEPLQSRTPLSLKSCASRNSIGRCSYREHRGPPARVRTPAPSQGSLQVVAPPCVDNPNLPGEPLNVGCRYYPFSVNGVSRYDNRAIRSPFTNNYTIDAMTYEYPDAPESVPEGWTAYQHPEGALYFVHDESKTFTELDVCDDEIHRDIEYFRCFLFSELETEIESRNVSEYLEVDKVQLVLEPKVDEQGVMCCYYFVNPRARSVFWLDRWDGDEIFRGCEGSLSLPHKGLAIQADYWSHCNIYPNFCKVTQELKDEVVDMILHATSDHLTSNTSASPLNPDELKSHLSLVDRIDPEKTDKRTHCVIIISRVMHVFYRNHFVNFYGEDCARLNFDQTIHGWRYNPSLLMTICAPLLFMAPVNNVRLLHRILIDNIASKDRWNVFVKMLNSQLQETSLLAIVLLSANIGFLPKQSGTGISPQQILSYMSLVASMASIILGLVFIGRNRVSARNTPMEVAKFLHELHHKRHGLEKLAIVYSLPYAFLVWGMFLFFVAFAVQWCYPDDTSLRIIAAVFMLIAFLLVVWCIWTSRVRCNFWWFQPDPKQPEVALTHSEHITFTTVGARVVDTGHQYSSSNVISRSCR